MNKFGTVSHDDREDVSSLHSCETDLLTTPEGELCLLVEFNYP